MNRDYYDPTPESDYLQDAIKEIESLEAKLKEINAKHTDINGALVLKLKVAVEALEKNSAILNNINATLDSRVYTLSEYEFEKIFFARDLSDEALKKISEGV